MKKIFAFFAILLVIAACKKDFLNRRPIVGTTEENFYRNAADALAGVNAAYAPLQFELSPAAHFRWFWGDIMSDDATKGGSGGRGRWISPFHRLRRRRWNFIPTSC